MELANAIIEEDEEDELPSARTEATIEAQYSYVFEERSTHELREIEPLHVDSGTVRVAVKWARQSSVTTASVLAWLRIESAADDTEQTLQLKCWERRLSVHVLSSGIGTGQRTMCASSRSPCCSAGAVSEWRRSVCGRRMKTTAPMDQRVRSLSIANATE